MDQVRTNQPIITLEKKTLTLPTQYQLRVKQSTSPSAEKNLSRYFNHNKEFIHRHVLLQDTENGTYSTSFRLIPDHQRAISHGHLCPDPASMCTEFLPSQEKQLFKSCTARSGKWRNYGKGYSYCHCQFMNTTSHNRVAILSLPGSGNTWLRGLLEKASGVCTGSYACDEALQAGGMCGEGLKDGVLGVKSHDPHLQWTGMPPVGRRPNVLPWFDAAIVLVRNPFRVMVAEWHRQNSDEIGYLLGSNHVKYLESSDLFCKYCF